MKNKKNGFTLIELLAVIVIVGLLFSFSTVAIASIKKKQDKENAKNVISGILTAAKRYEADNQYIHVNKADGIPISNLSSYTEYDKVKYNNLNGLVVSVEECSNKLKLKYSIDLSAVTNSEQIYGSKKYSDCGCDEQIVGTANKLCTD